MTKEEANRINTLLKNVTNVQILLADLLIPIEAVMQKYNSTKQQAITTKINAEEYLKKYGVFTLDTTIKGIQQMTKNIDEEQKDNKEQQVKILQTHWT